MTGWLTDTLVWTGVLIALVLVLRRPVADRLGARAAYALWLLPFARMVLPPIELPARLAPAPQPSETVFVLTGDVTTLASNVPVAGEPVDWGAWLLALWLGGAALFLARRIALYARMRRVLLADARPVGRSGPIRLVETPVAASPVAFGVIDKVIALPPGFMAWPDRTARDLALAHELAHHRGHDLLANFAVQPLFALHWFNPLGWLGWAALRRDQEAACDARVVEHCERSERAAYATLIAGLAAGPNIALAAPMACPVLGEKSIIQRLRSLTMTDISPRRRLLGRALVAGGLLALPVTASISHAEGSQAPVAPLAPVTALSSTAPVAPSAPSAPQATGEVAEAPEPGERVERKVVVIKHTDGGEDREGKSHGEPHVTVDENRHVIILDGKFLSEDEHARLRSEMKGELKKMEGALAQARKVRHITMVETSRSMNGNMPQVDFECDGAIELSEKTTAEGTRKQMVCRSGVNATALSALKRARQSLVDEKGLSDAVREEALDALDQQIAKMSGSAE